MPLRVYLNAERSPYYRIRGNVLGERVDRSSGLAGKKEAQALADRIAAEIRQRRIAGEPDKPKELTFAQAAVNYLLEPGRGTAFDADLRTLGHQFGALPLSAITQSLLDAYVQTRHAGQSPESVIRHTLTPLSAVLRHAGLTPKFRRPKRPKGRLRYLTRDEADKLIAAASDHLKPLIVFCINTGARMGEALALEWSEVNLAARRVVFLETKNGTSRGIPLNGSAVEALANMTYRTGIRNPDGTWQRRAERAGRVFRTPAGAPYPLLENAGGQIRTGWAGACRRAGIKDATPHTMRHTFASWLAMSGVPLRTIAELLGHKDLSMVMRYSHLAPDHLAGAVDAISATLQNANWGTDVGSDAAEG